MICLSVIRPEMWLTTVPKNKTNRITQFTIQINHKRSQDRYRPQGLTVANNDYVFEGDWRVRGQ